MSKFLNERNSWDIETSIILTCSFTQGSCTLCGYKLTPQGFEWGSKCKEVSNNPIGYSDADFERVQLILSEKFMGFYMIPDNEIWNYNFIGVEPVSNMNYGLILGNPQDFYHEIHRSGHFVNFGSSFGKDNGNKKGSESDLEDNIHNKENCDVENNFD